MEYMAAQMDRHIEACQHWEEERLDAIAWAAYTKAWPEAMAGQPTRSQRMRDAGFTPRPRVLGAGGMIRSEYEDE